MCVIYYFYLFIYYLKVLVLNLHALFLFSYLSEVGSGTHLIAELRVNILHQILSLLGEIRLHKVQERGVISLIHPIAVIINLHINSVLVIYHRNYSLLLT